LKQILSSPETELSGAFEPEPRPIGERSQLVFRQTAMSTFDFFERKRGA
jgi:hypothetical protein